jgi:hypothetical protein
MHLRDLRRKFCLSNPASAINIVGQPEHTGFRSRLAIFICHPAFACIRASWPLKIQGAYSSVQTDRRPAFLAA